MLTKEQIALRDGRLTASRVSVLMTGDKEGILALWREMVDEDVESEDFSNNWPAALGSHTESLNLDWYAKKTGHAVIHRGEVAIHDEDEWMAATLDGWDEVDAMPVEAKHVGGFESAETVLARYQPQMHWQMIVTRASKCAFSVIYGAKEPVVEIIEFNKEYGDELLRRAQKFMSYVWAFTPPVVLAPVAPPVLASIKYDMSKERVANQWGDAAARWLASYKHAEKAKLAEKDLKAMVPIDANEASGFGVRITRNKAGALALREEK